MKYPLYVHNDEGSSFGAQFFDMPEVFTFGESLDEIERNAQEAVEARFDESNDPVPSPTHDPKRLRESDLDSGDGFWLFVEIDTTKLERAVRLNISLPGSLVNRIDAAARDRKLSRSAFLALAAEHEMTANA